MIKVPALINKFCDAVWEYNADTNEVFFHCDDMNPELCGDWIFYDAINRMYQEQYVKAADMEIWERMLTPEALKKFVEDNRREAHFFIQFENTKKGNECHEVFFERLEGKRVLLASRDVKELQQNAAIAKAVIPEYDYVTCIDIASQKFVRFCSQENKSIVPPNSGNYNEVLEDFNNAYVIPEEAEKLTEQMKLEHVVRELEEKGDYVLYATIQENHSLSYKKMRFTYLDEKKNKVLLTRTDIGALVGERKLREIEREKRLRYLQNMPVAFCSTRVLVDENGEPYDFQFTYCNHAHEELEGVKEGELLGKKFYEFFKETDREWLTYYYETAYKGINHVIQRYSPEIQKHLLIYTFQSEPGNCECVLLDTSEQFFLNHELERSRENLKRIMEMTTALVFQFYPDAGEVVQLERGKEGLAERLPVETVLQKLIADEMLDAAYCDTLEDAFSRMKNGEHSQAIVVRGKLHRDQRWKWYRVTMFDFRDGNTHERMVFGFLQNIDQDKNREEELKKKAQTDSLTGLFNAGTGKEKVCKKLEIKQENDGHYQAMFVMDIDNFKIINDTQGHLTGDRMLKAFAGALRRTFRTEDVIYRLGGDEFVVFVDGIQNPQLNIARMLQRLQTNIKETEKADFLFSCSAGVFASYKSYSFEEYYEKADRALYETKNGNKGYYTIHLEEQEE